MDFCHLQERVTRVHLNLDDGSTLAVVLEEQPRLRIGLHPKGESPFQRIGF